jgi:hypothetical protein
MHVMIAQLSGMQDLHTLLAVAAYGLQPPRCFHTHNRRLTVLWHLMLQPHHVHHALWPVARNLKQPSSRQARREAVPSILVRHVSLTDLQA